MSENTEPILPGAPLPCDHPTATFVNGHCTCLICARCGKHTGNRTQGHFWSYCKVTGEMRDFHFCCPDDCELEDDGGQ